MIDKVQDNTIIICELDYRKKLLKELSNQKLFLNLPTFVTLQTYILFVHQ